MRETSEPCWCAALPPLQAVDPLQNCLCPACLTARVQAQARADAPAGIDHDGR